MSALSRIAVVCVGLVLGMGAVVGCSTDDEAPATGNGGATGTSSTGSVDAPAAPELPKAASAHTAPGAKAFARHWVALLNHATLTGELTALRDVDAACAACAELAGAIGALYADGGRIETTGWKVTEVVADPDAAAGTARVQLSVTRAPEAVFVRADAEPQTFSGGKEQYVMALAWQDGWRITELTTVAR